MQEICIKLDTNFDDIKAILSKLSKENKLEICLNYISSFKSAKGLRIIISELCDNYSVKSTDKSRMILVIDELNNNAIEYWSLEGETNKIYLKINREEKGVDISIEVEDTGNWNHAKTVNQMEILKEYKKRESLETIKSIRWRGLFLIIEKIVDDLYFKNSANWWLIVWIRKFINKK